MAETEKGCKHEYEHEPDRRCPHPLMEDENGEEMDYCIFHAPIGVKENRADEFWEEFEKHFAKTEADFDAAETDEEKGRVWLDCEGFVFPDAVGKLRRKYPFGVTFAYGIFNERADFSDSVFEGEAYFWGSSFNYIADFSEARFGGNTNFVKAKFNSNANFQVSVFVKRASFHHVVFAGEAFFSWSNFEGKTEFSYTIFEQDLSFYDVNFAAVVNFQNVIIQSESDFSGSQFGVKSDFNSSKFEGLAYFDNASFFGEVRFGHTEFKGDASFNMVNFESIADFRYARFARNTYFYRAIFKGNAQMQGTVFNGRISFAGSVFKDEVSYLAAWIIDRAEFSGIRFLSAVDFRNIITNKVQTETEIPGELITVDTEAKNVYLDNVYFDRPELVSIGGKDTTLERWSFRGSNIENVNFSLEEWSKRKGRKYCYDEELAGDDDSNISYKDAAEVYRKLRLNYESRLAYDEASDFHYGQMVCRWKDETRSKWDRLLTGGYWLISKYGQSVGRPLVALLALVALFALLYVIVGFDVDETGYFGIYNRSLGVVGPESGEWWAQLLTVVKFSARNVFSLKFEGTLLIQIISGFQKLLSAACITFFVLALRRKFKR